MNPKRMFYRRKEGGITISGYSKGKAVHIWTLPKDPNILMSLLKKVSYFPIEKQEKIDKNIECLDSKSKRRPKGSPKLRTTNLIRRFEKDTFDKEEEEEFDSPDDLIEELKER
ncbi:hypothetical protein LCGC14_2801750 [marine sediment metagenome]|uniref:Uncharacterized protein n=1 Tax=marine sediment metagenome TaxID=412755 RepID=A0A0F9BDW4_9ZZZZ